MHNLCGLNVCFLAGTLAQGGAERQLFYILQALSHAGASARVLSLDQGRFWEGPIKAMGIPITWVGDRPSRLARLVRIMKEVRKNLPDVLHSQHFFTNTYVSASARLLRVSGIGVMQADGRHELSDSGPLKGWLNLRSPRVLAVNSKNAIRFAVAQGVAASRLYFLPNAVDTEWFKPSDCTPEKPITVVAVGRLVREKRMDRFISILSRLRAHFHLDVRGLIVGPSAPTRNLRPELEEHARSLGLYPEYLQFLGGVSDVRPIYHRGAVCVLTSDWEGTPNVLLEAMACGLPVVSTNVGGVADIVEQGRTGFLLERDDLDGFASALANLVTNRELRLEMGRRARAFVEENHSLKYLTAYLDGLYKHALPRRILSPTPALQGSAS
jgi:glycosyltransferase involved in cell wall biosynthesis